MATLPPLPALMVLVNLQLPLGPPQIPDTVRPILLILVAEGKSDNGLVGKISRGVGA